MAKISELVKTYKLLNDPNAPEWNVKFVGAAVLALAIVAAGAGALWVSNQDGADAAPAAAAATSEPEAPPRACSPEELQAELARSGSLPESGALPSGCIVV